VITRLLLALALLPGLTAPAAAQGAAPSPAPEIVKAIAEVASSDAAVQEAAAVALGKTGDRKLLPLLEALREGSVYVRSLPGGKKETLIVGDKVNEGDKTLVPIFTAYGREPIQDPAGKPLLVELSKLEEVPAGRSLRLVLRPLIDAFSGSTQLADRTGPSGRPPPSRWAIAASPARADPGGPREGKDRWVATRSRKRRAHPAEVGAGEARQRRRQAGRPRQRRRLRSAREVAPPTRARSQAGRGGCRQAHPALVALDPGNQVMFRVSLSSILLLMASAAIIFGLMGVINMAHGELMALGAYTTYVTQGWFQGHAAGLFDYYFLVALPLSFLVAGMAGFVLERGVIRFLYGRPLETLLLTWGISLMIQQGLRLWFGAANVDVISPTWLSGGVPVMVGIQLPFNRLFIIGLATVAVAGMYFLLFKTDAGLRIRAVTQNRGMAACLGVRSRRVDALTFALGAGLAGIAGAR
jgi:urea transport system permease protein